jgi:secreted PhoX family phosphatase
VDAANPRPHNVHGQMLRWREEGDAPAATRFRWDLFLLAGETLETATTETPPEQCGSIEGDAFSSPDGLMFDSSGRLWIATDYDDSAPHQQTMGCNQLLCADPVTRQVKRFLVGPRGCEITGLAFTPDERTLWINVQHPGLSYPASDGKTRPRSTTVMITRKDGGRIGS